MRDLQTFELSFVSGAGGCYTPPPPCECPAPSRRKNNNGYGNGPESGRPPGNSGAHNPQLLPGPDFPNKNNGPRHSGGR
jgi:hypothetical protein